VSDPHISVVVVNHNLAGELIGCLESVRRHSPPGWCEIWVVDNASTDESLERLAREFPAARVIANRDNLGFGRASNQALERARGDYALLLNNDARLTAGALEALAAALEADPDLAMVGPKLLDPSGEVQISTGRMIHFHTELWQRLLGWAYARRLPGMLAFVRRRAERPARPHWVSGACCLLRLEAARRAGLFDPSFFMYTEEVDLCQRLRLLGYQVGYVPAAVVIHRGGGSSALHGARTALEYRRSQMYFYRKHHGRLALELLRAYLLAKFLLGELKLLRAGPERRRLNRELLRAVWRYPKNSEAGACG